MVSLSTADGRHIDVFGRVTLPLQIAKHVILVELIVANCAEEIILGIPYLAQSQCKIDFGTMKMHLFGTAVPCYDAKARPLSSAVRVTQTVTIDPGTECIVPGRVNRIAVEQEGLLGPTKGFVRKHKVLVANVLVNTKDNNKVPMRLYNPGRIPVTIYKGSLAAQIQPVQEVYSVGDVEQILARQATENENPESSAIYQVPEHLQAVFDESAAELSELERSTCKTAT
jgi:hypothetical protein